MHDDELIDLDVQQVSDTKPMRANIYKGRIARIEPSLEAAFVDFGEERHGFLPLKEVIPFYRRSSESTGDSQSSAERLQVGQELLVQVERTERDKKGAALTTYISLAGKYLVMLLEGSEKPGISRRVNRDQRRQASEQLKQLEEVEGFGMILRTEGVGKSIEELRWDLQNLQGLWQRINEVADDNKAPCLILSEADIFMRTVRDHFNAGIESVIVDDEAMYQRFINLLSRYDPEQSPIVQHYQSSVPLFSRYNVEAQIANAFNSRVHLPSGGSIVIDQTEALVAIDINSARSTKSSNIEDTAFNTNMEAAREIARQLRIRDIGGLIVIDFIDMMRTGNQRSVRKQLLEMLEMDRARVQVGDISRFGLLEMSRQRLGQSLSESTTMVCPRCRGMGKVRSSEFMAISIMRLLYDLSVREKTMQISALLPVPVAAFLLNEKRNDINILEQQYDINILVVPSPNMHTPFFEITCTNVDGSSYVMKDEESLLNLKDSPSQYDKKSNRKSAKQGSKNREPLIKEILPQTPVPRAKSGFWQALVTMFTGDSAASTSKSSGRNKTKAVRKKSTGNRPTEKSRDSVASNSEDKRGQRGQRNSRYPATSRARQSNRNQQRSSQPGRGAPGFNQEPGGKPQSRRSNDSGANKIGTEVVNHSPTRPAKEVTETATPPEPKSASTPETTSQAPNNQTNNSKLRQRMPNDPRVLDQGNS